MKDVTLYLMKDKAFVDMGNGYMLCVGTKSEVDEATPERLVEMINEAIAHSRYHSISSAARHTLH